MTRTIGKTTYYDNCQNPKCGKPLDGSRPKYCSHECNSSDWRRSYRSAPTTRICARTQCAKEFQREGNNQKYCCPKCAHLTQLEQMKEANRLHNLCTDDKERRARNRRYQQTRRDFLRAKPKQKDVVLSPVHIQYIPVGNKLEETIRLLLTKL